MEHLWEKAMRAEACSALTDACVNSVNHVIQDNETNVWYSRLCHINFGCMTRLAGLNLIPKFDLVKGSK